MFRPLRIVTALMVALLVPILSAATVSAEPTPTRLAFLGVLLQNDNEGLEPTTDAERSRMAAIGKQFTSTLAASGHYEIVQVPEEMLSKVNRGQPLGHCGGCEADYGRTLKADRVAWIVVQKVSNLILNMNVYVADVASDKYVYIKSVDIRGNTDESWSRSLKYLLDNYFFEQKS